MDETAGAVFSRWSRKSRAENIGLLPWGGSTVEWIHTGNKCETLRLGRRLLARGLLTGGQLKPSVRIRFPHQLNEDGRRGGGG